MMTIESDMEAHLEKDEEDLELKADTQVDVLKALHRLYLRKQEYPKYSELLAEINKRRIMSPQHLTNTKEKLMDKGFIQELPGKRYALTERGGKYFLTHYDVVVPTRVRVFGEVMAGLSNPDDLIVDMYKDEDEHNTVMIPEAYPDRQVFALEVVGTSMLEEGIVEGDYAIIEECGIDEIQDDDLIVTLYLPEKYLKADEETLNYMTSDQNELQGPTLKYCHVIPHPERDMQWKEVVQDGEIVYERRIFQLRQRKLINNEIKEKMIVTPFINPFGKVVGIYRSLRQRKRSA